MHAHLSCRAATVRSALLALLLPALLALGAVAAGAQSYLDANPSLTGGWYVNASPLAVGGIYYTTFNTQSTPSSVALWSVNLPQGGTYQLYVSSVPTLDVPRTANATYVISTAAGSQVVGGVGQEFAGERLLGTFMLNAGVNTVQLTDLTGEPQLSHTVVANAARWVLISGPPPPLPPPGTPYITGYLDFYGNAVIAAPPGTAIQIIGNNFGSSGSVAFAGHNAPIVRWSPTDIRVLTPLTGSYPTIGPVTVTSGGQTVSGPTFRIDPNAPQPQPAPQVPVITGYAATNPRGAPIPGAPPGAPVLVEGSNFGTTGTVAFNGLPAQVVTWSPTELLVTVPPAPFYPYPGPVTVTANGQTAVGPVFTITAPTPGAGGDWTVFMHDPRQTGLTDAGLDPRTLMPWTLPLGGPPGISPVVLGRTAYVGTGAGTFAIDTASRSLRWVRLQPAPVRSAPAVTAQVVVISAGGLYGLNPADGSLLWQRPDIVADGDVSPMLVDGTVYIGARGAGGGPAMFAVSAATGANVWAAPLPAGFEVRATAAALPGAGLLFVVLGPPAAAIGPAAGPSAVLALRLADGSPAWASLAQFPTGTPPAGIAVGYAGSGAQPGPGGVLPALLQAAVFVAAGQNVTALGAYTGASIWSRPLPETALPEPPVLSTANSTGSTLYVAGASGRIYALNSITGADAPGTPSAMLAGVTGTLGLAGSTLYVPTSAGLAAIDLPTGALIWTSPQAAGSGVAIAGGTPYVVTPAGQFVGFAP